VLRNLNLTRDNKRICGTPRVGVLGSAVPTAGPPFALLLSEVQSAGLAARFVRLWVESSTFPAGVLKVQEDSSWSAVGAAAGSYTVNGRLFIDDVDSGARSYPLSIGPATTKPALRNMNLTRNNKRICGTPYVGVLGSAVPTIGPPNALLFNDVLTHGLGANRVRIWLESSTFPAGALFVFEDSSYTFSGTPIANGVYSAQGRLFIDDSDQGSALFQVTVGP
jgi:hypothetical protein